jgi:hypothetical protein
MNLAKYEELTGTTVPASQQAMVNANILRSKSILENMLGYPLSSKNTTNYYNELGKTVSDFILETDVDNLAAADEVEGSYRLFDYHDADRFLSIDPITQIYAVKLVYILGDQVPASHAVSGITVKTFELDEYSIHVSAGNIKKYLERIDDCWDLICGCSYRNNVQLAVDAIWSDFDCLPSDLKYLWVDMVTFYSDPKKDIIKQTLGSHSWQKGTVAAPDQTDAFITTVRKYAGPHGSVRRTVTI